ncbi:MAG: hypothetical protein KDB62_05510 [Solirubrobacterales bacterium]|nr:hypothetical protein [Solirubrobacterales bacterium]
MTSGRLTLVTVLLGALVVVLSQFVTAYTLEDPFGATIATVTLAGKHGLATTLLAVVAALAVLYAMQSGSKAASIIVIGMGVAVLLVFLIVDLPDLDSVGLYNVEGAGNLDATGHASAGLWMELTGAIILILGGLAMATLNREQLQAAGPGTTPT